MNQPHAPADTRHTPEKAREMLGQCRTIAVVGLSPNPVRDSNKLASYLLRAGFKVILVKSKEETILGQKCYPNLAAISAPVDLVDVFLASEFAADVAREAGLAFVQDACLMVEHRRHLARPA